MSQYPGAFIVLEGIDGAGTTTLASRLQDTLDDTWNFTQEPSHGKYGRIIREELQSDSDPTLSDMFLFLADRYDHIQSLIGPTLDRGEHIICDRYNLSTFAYQTPVVDDELAIIDGYQYIAKSVEPWVIEPDLTIWLDIPVQIALQRYRGNEKYEKRHRLESAREIYAQAHERLDYVQRIDGTKAPDLVEEEAIDLIANA